MRPPTGNLPQERRQLLSLLQQFIAPQRQQLQPGERSANDHAKDDSEIHGYIHCSSLFE